MRTDPRSSKTPLRPDATGRGTHAGRGRRHRSPSMAEGWFEMPWSIRVLRASLGVTFLFAGLQKFLDPNFFRPGGGDYIGTQLAAYSRACTHEGCLVGYDQSSQILVCPCHGAEFDPAHQAEAIAGPTRTPLEPIKVVVDRPTGDVILPA